MATRDDAIKLMLLAAYCCAIAKLMGDGNTFDEAVKVAEGNMNRFISQNDPAAFSDSQSVPINDNVN